MVFPSVGRLPWSNAPPSLRVSADPGAPPALCSFLAANAQGDSPVSEAVEVRTSLELTAPDAPLLLVTARTGGSLTVQFDELDTGGEPISKFELQFALGGAGEPSWQPAVDVPGATTGTTKTSFVRARAALLSAP